MLLVTGNTPTTFRHCSFREEMLATMALKLAIYALCGSALCSGFQMFSPVSEEFPLSQLESRVASEWHSTMGGDEALNTQSSFLETNLGTSTQGQAMKCECDKVKCNCVRRCDCRLPDESSSLLELQSEIMGSVEQYSSFLQEPNQQLDCNCEKVKCDCIKPCKLIAHNICGGGNARYSHGNCR